MISPYWVAFFLIWADTMWVLQRRHGLKFNPVPLILTLAVEALTYIGFGLFDVPIDLRAMLVRWSIAVVAFSMAFPLTLAYLLYRKPSWTGIF